ncbi:hypothetical protein CKAN_00838000 [Cinnamomum micranthum f. kanehirae]|uniref:Uncharacterized protein n=1 Tax=Cinnamomum micranthum f. kanehirae TaxID=337451 RepID=A0A443NMM9_9MAGN|nr:hypothetical protein CKAN_00838000 [Cinnamomum micranthum f. kanehirae]
MSGIKMLYLLRCHSWSSTCSPTFLECYRSLKCASYYSPQNKSLFDSGGCLEDVYLLFGSMNSIVKSLILLHSRLLISFFKNFKQQQMKVRCWFEQLDVGPAAFEAERAQEAVGPSVEHKW